ncbi:MAG: hypothetical protein MUC58_02900 [Rhizobiaceae bacterium]|jgi:hypothetical protein|nr:hypothetical protein [Rhizobiaceae bacterium]
MADHGASPELDKLRRRYADLGAAIDGLVGRVAASSSTTEAVLSAELGRARKELASIARRLKDLSGE